MKTPLQITYRQMASTEAVESYIRRRADKLEDFCDSLVGCHVNVEIPHRHKQHGYHYRVRVDMKLPGEEIVVANDSDASRTQEDLYAAIDDVFTRALRLLER